MILYYITGFIVNIFCIYFHRITILDLYTKDEDVNTKKILSMAYVVLFIGNIFLWPIVVYIYICSVYYIIRNSMVYRTT